MAGFSFNSVDALSADLQRLASLSEDERWKILSAGAEVLKAAQERRLNELFTARTWQLFGSLKISRKKSDSGLAAVVSPTGKRKKGSSGKRTYRGRSNGSYQGTNAEVAYILEYGSPRITATHWMETANETASDAFDAATLEAWNEHVRRSGF